MITAVLTTCGRQEYTRQTCESFLHHNRSGFRLFYADDASDDNLRKMVEGYGFQPLLLSDRQQGVNKLASATVQKLQGDDLVLWLQNDWLSVRPINLAMVEELFAREEIGTLRLYGQYKGRDKSLSCLRYFMGDKRKRPVVWKEEVIEGNALQIGRLHWGYPPAITRKKLLCNVLIGCRGAGGPEMSSQRYPFLTARVVDNVVVHIGARRTPHFHRD